MNTKQLIGSVFDTALKIVIIIVVVMFTYKYATDAYNFGYRIFAEEPVSEEGNAKVISIAITEDATTMDIGKVLEEKGLIDDARLFYVQEMLSKYRGEIKPGIYELSSDMTAKEMMEVMSAGTENTADENASGAAGDTSEEADMQGDTTESDGMSEGTDVTEETDME